MISDFDSAVFSFRFYLISLFVQCYCGETNMSKQLQHVLIASIQSEVKVDVLIIFQKMENGSLDFDFLKEKSTQAKFNGISFVSFPTTGTGTGTQMLTNSLASRSPINGPLLILFPCENQMQIFTVLSHIIAFQQNNERGKLWNPIFIILYNSLPLRIAMNDINGKFSPYLAKLSLQSFVYFLSGSICHSNNNSILIQEIYTIRNNILKIELEINVKTGFNFLNYFIFNTQRRSNFRKSTVIAIAMDEVNYPLATKFKPNSTELISGFEVEVFHYFRDSLNFSEQVVKGIGWVRDGPNETLTGYAMQLNKNNKGDIAIGAGEFLEARMKGPEGITYIHPIFYAHVTAYFKQPPPNTIRNVFTQAFTATVWISILSIWFMIVIILKISVCLRKRRRFCNPTDNRIAQDSIIWAISTICQQGWYMSPSSSSIKITFLCGLFTGLVTYVAYSASLVSLLSVEVVPIRQFSDLLTEKFFIASDSRIPTSTDFVKSLEDTNKIPNLGEIRDVDISKNLENLINSRFALVTIPDSFYPVIQKNYSDQYICSTVASKVVKSRPLMSSCFIKRGSHLREFFNYKLLVMQERGVKHRMMKHYVMGTSIQCLESSGSFQLNFGLDDLFTPFCILTVGILISLMTVLMENCCSFKMEYKNKST